MKTKTMILAASLCAIAFTTNAQTEKGNNLIGGSVNFVSANSNQAANNYKQTEFTIGPKFAHFISKNLALGLNVNYGYSKISISSQQFEFVNGAYISSSTVTQIRKQHETNIGPLVRYYLDITDKFKFFGEFNASVGFGKSEQSNSNPSEAKTTTYNAAVIPSFAFFPTKKLAVELGFGLISYSNSTSKYDSPNTEKIKDEAFRFGFESINPTLGINFHF